MAIAIPLALAAVAGLVTVGRSADNCPANTYYQCSYPPGAKPGTKKSCKCSVVADYYIHPEKYTNDQTLIKKLTYLGDFYQTWAKNGRADGLSPLAEGGGDKRWSQFSQYYTETQRWYDSYLKDKPTNDLKNIHDGLTPLVSYQQQQTAWENANADKDGAPPLLSLYTPPRQEPKEEETSGGGGTGAKISDWFKKNSSMVWMLIFFGAGTFLFYSII